MGLAFYTFDIVKALSVLTIAGQGIAVVLLGMMAVPKATLTKWVSRHALLLMFIVAIVAVSGSLFFSEIAQWVPCKDCWLQRICMYPQIVLLAIALWKRDRKIAPYILSLCLIGIIIATYHYATQVHAAFFPQPDEAGVNVLLKPCDASGVSCAATQIDFYFGYITIPMMALTGFILNAIGSLYLLRSKS